MSGRRLADTTAPVAVLIGTLDTKGREYGYVRDLLVEQGIDVVLVDVGVLGEATIAPDFSAREVAEAVGVEIGSLRGGGEGGDARGRALEVMRAGATQIVQDLVAAGRCHGVLGLGGSGGSALISGVMRSLPFGVPKLLVSTMASGDVSPYVGASDLCLMHSVTDIAGLNRISVPILRNAAGALAGMLALPADDRAPDRPAVGITMLGVTTPAALRIVDRLEEAGFDPVVFHAVGSGGRALESLVKSGVITGVVDLTIKEVTDDLLGGVFVAGPDRMRTAGRRGIPQVVVPGAVEVINFGPLDTAPAHLRDGSRALVQHNEQVTAVRATRSELLQVAEAIAERLNEARGQVNVVVPRGGFDSYAAHDGPFSSPADDAAFVERLRARLRPEVEVVESDADINDPRFADLVADRFLLLISPSVG